MSAQTNLVAAIQRFNEWHYPWLFEPRVTASLRGADAELFREVWAEARDEKHWLHASDLSKGGDAACEVLSRRYPWLPPEAVEALANAAAFQWR